MFQKGIAPIILIFLVVAVLGVGAGSYVVQKKQPKLVGGSDPPTSLGIGGHGNLTPSTPTTTSENGDVEKKDVEQAIRFESPRVGNEKKDNQENPSERLQITPVLVPFSLPKLEKKELSIKEQFEILDNELKESKESGFNLSPDHSARILKDLNELDSKGYPFEEIERLRAITLELSPHLSDAFRKEQSSQVSTDCLKANPVLSEYITDFSLIQKITAPGSPSTEGPKGHSFVWTEKERVPVYAPAHAILDSGAYYTGGDGATQYVLFFNIKGVCDFSFKFDHIDELVDKIRNAFPADPRPTEDTSGESPSEKVTVNAGELIGYTRGTRTAGNWDFGLYNMAEKGALRDAYGLHSHSVCWVDYYSIDKQKQYRDLLDGPELVCSFGDDVGSAVSQQTLEPQSQSQIKPEPVTPTPDSWLLPFTENEISYDGSWVVAPFSETNGDIWFEIKPNTILRASFAGEVYVGKNPIGTTPDGLPFDPKDWELHIKIGNGAYYLEYDHMVDVLVSSGDTVYKGQPLGKASPASIRHGGIEGLKPVDEFEWGLRQALPTSAKSLCPLKYLEERERTILSNIISAMPSKGFKTYPSACFAEETDG